MPVYKLAQNQNRTQKAWLALNKLAGANSVSKTITIHYTIQDFFNVYFCFTSSPLSGLLLWCRPIVAVVFESSSAATSSRVLIPTFFAVTTAALKEKATHCHFYSTFAINDDQSIELRNTILTVYSVIYDQRDTFKPKMRKQCRG